MKVLKVEEYPLTNFEVKEIVEQHFENRKEKLGVRESNFKRFRDPLLDFQCRLLYYFDKQTKVNNQNEESIRSLLNELGPFKLTRSEKMLVINSPPTSLVEIHSIIENCESRYSEDQILEMLEIIQKNISLVITKEKKERKRESKSSEDMSTWYEFTSKVDEVRRKKMEKKKQEKAKVKQGDTTAITL